MSLSDFQRLWMWRPNHGVLFAIVAIFVGNFLFTPSAKAQSESGSVSGRVTDQSNAVVPDVEVQITNVDTGVSQATKTNGDGFYSFPFVKPGNYLMNVRKQSFRTVSVTGITLNVQDNLSRNFVLQVGSSAESITVTVDSGAALINTTNGTVSTIVDRQFVNNLPLNGRSFNTLLQLTPGVVIAQQPSGSASGTAPGQFSMSGQRTDANSFTVDGVSANFGVAAFGRYSGESGTGSAQAFSALGGTSSLVSVDALQEFRVETSSFSPEFGKSPGGQVILTTRAGTNEFHGGIFEYFRNDVMDANDWFANQAGNPRAPERHNDFGGYLGGRILKDRTFFFVSYEGARLRLPQTAVTTVPSVDARSGASAAIAPYLDAFPLPNGPASSDGFIAQFTGSYSNRATLDAFGIRVDHTVNDRFSLFGRYNYAPSNTLSRSPEYSLSFLEGGPVNTQTVTIGANILLTNAIANVFKGNYSVQTSNFVSSMDSFGGAVPLAPSAVLGSLPKANNLGAFETFDTGFYSFGPVSNNRARQVDLVDDLSAGTGTHQLKFGGDFRTIFLDKDPNAYGVTIIADSVEDLISTGAAEFYTNAYLPTHLTTHSLSLYGQDSWKASSRLTVTYGLRWELAPAPSARDHSLLASWTNVNNPAQITLAPFGTSLWRTTYGNFAPRGGAAYKLTENGDLVLRAAWGIFYDLGVGRVADVGSFFPGTSTAVTPDVNLPVGDVTPYLPAISTQPPYPFVAAFSPNLKLPRSYQWNVALEKAFGSNQAVSVTYVGQAGRDLLRQEAFYQPNSDFQSDFMLTDNSARSNYNAVQVQYRRPLVNRLQLLLNYTFSHSLDNASDDVVAGLANTILSGANDYASSSFDVRHSFSGAITYAVPSVGQGVVRVATRDWMLSSVIVVRTGFPFNAVLYEASPDPGGTALSRPDRVPGEPVWIPNAAAGGGKSLNPAAFAIPNTVRQGTEGRNDISGFGLSQVDMSVARSLPLGERFRLQFRADAFNLLNHPNFTNPSGYIEFGPTYLQSSEMLNSGLGGLNPLFQEGGPRSLQVSLRLNF